MVAGRDPYFEPKSHADRRTNIWARMAKLWEHPGRLYSTAEAAFCTIGCVRSVTPHVQEHGLAIVTISGLTTPGE